MACLLPCKMAVLSPGGRKWGEPELGVGAGKTPPKQTQHTPPKRGEGAPTGGPEWMDCYSAPGGCHRQGGDRKTPPQPSSSQSPGLSYKQVFQDLTSCWSEAGKGLTHSTSPSPLGPASGPTQKGMSGPGPRTTVSGPSSAPPLCPAGLETWH